MIPVVRGRCFYKYQSYFSFALLSETAQWKSVLATSLQLLHALWKYSLKQCNNKDSTYYLSYAAGTDLIYFIVVLFQLYIFFSTPSPVVKRENETLEQTSCSFQYVRGRALYNVSPQSRGTCISLHINSGQSECSCLQTLFHTRHSGVFSFFFFVSSLGQSSAYEEL